MLRLIRPYGLNQLLTRHLSITAQQEKRIQFFLSDIGEGTKEVVIKEWFVTEGQQVEEFDELVEVQSDKATVPITSRYAGKIVKIHYDLEDTALVGKPLVDIEVEDADDEPIDHYESEPEEVKKPTVKKAVKSSGGSAKGKAKAKPAVRKFAKENGVDLNDVTGSGKNGIVTKDDVLAFMSQGQQASAPPPVFHPPTQQQAPPQPIQQTFKELPTRNIVSSGGSRREPLGPIAKAMTKSMNEANKIPHFGYKGKS